MAADSEVAPSADAVVDETVELVAEWLQRARTDETPAERAAADRLSRLMSDDESIRFVMRFVDRVARHRSNRLAARQLRRLVRSGDKPAFLGLLDRLQLRVGGALAPLVPWLVVPLARRRMRQLVGPMVVDSDPDTLGLHVASRRGDGYRLNLNLLGEAVLGEEEAARRRRRTFELIDRPDIDYVSVKVSAIASQIDLWSFAEEQERIEDRLRGVFEHSAASSPPTFVNLDMEEYRDLAITLGAFTSVLDEDSLAGLDAGIAIQAYLPDSVAVLHDLVEWANRRHDRSGSTIKIRLVKGANLAMERVDAALHGWTQAPYATKAEVDANYKRCLDWLLTPERTRGVLVGVGSHNLFDVAWARLLARARGVEGRVQLEMLQGMAPAQQRAVAAAAGDLLLYTPVVGRDDFDVAISYLFRRLEENTAPENFLRRALDLEPGTPELEAEADRFRTAVADRDGPATRSRRAELPAVDQATFHNQPGSDPTRPETREWIAGLRQRQWVAPVSWTIDDPDAVEEIVDRTRAAQRSWWEVGSEGRSKILLEVADEIERRRGDLLVAMAREAGKVFAEADPEVSEAVDFARWYAHRATELDDLAHVTRTARGVVAVTPPWNFPVAIPAGGVLAALAVGNSVVFKPAPETPGCAEIVAEACWAAGVPHAALQFVRVPDGDAGRRLVESADAVVLTGSIDTARMFRGWRNDMVLLAETSGKNAIVVTPNADLDQAVADIVHSAFGHTGQKCSAASLAIAVGSVYDDERFRRQLVDAARSLRVGPAIEPLSAMGPTIAPVEGELARALETLEPGESWLLEPSPLDDSGSLWSPGIKEGVAAGSFFHRTECFGPVLGLMRARNLDHAIDLQNGTRYGLTGGIQSLDEAEIARWLEGVEVGNAYVNRGITGAIVGRQPFGGWKASAVGPAAKAGGPDYLIPLSRWAPRGRIDGGSLGVAGQSDQQWWDDHYSREHDYAGLFCEANLLRYRVRPDVIIRAGEQASTTEVERLIRAAERVGARPVVSVAHFSSMPEGRVVLVETEQELRERMEKLEFGRVRLIGRMDHRTRVLAAEKCIDVVDDPVTLNGRLELRWFLREQVVSRTLHRFGNLVGVAGKSTPELEVRPGPEETVW